MKKTISLILAVLMIAVLFIVPVSAAPGNENFGSAKKISDSDINMGSGEKDAVWDYALAIPVADQTGGGEINGTTLVLWSDTAFYFYTEVNDPTPVSVDLSGWTDGDYFDAWVSDSVEVFIVVEGEQGDIDAKNVGNYDDHCWQFRVDRDGIPSTYQRAGAWTDDFLCGASVNKDRLQWAVKTDGNKYYVKMKILMLTPKAGEVGLQVQINDLQEEGGSAPQVRANGASGSWDVDQFGYIVLVNEPAYVAPAVVDEPAADVPAPAVDTPAPAPVSPAPSSPTTGDAGMIILAGVMIIAAAGVVVFRKQTAK